MNTGDLNKRVTIHRATKTDNGLNKVNQWSAIKTVYANIHYVSDGEKFRAGTVSRKLAVRITIRNPNGFEVRPTDRIQVGTTTFEVAGVKPIDRDRFVEISADYTK